MGELASKELGIIRESYASITTPYPGCVDGRAPISFALPDGTPVEGNYAQLLGGSLHMAAARWLLQQPTMGFDQSSAETYDLLAAQGVKAGVHDDDHCLHSKERCGCGFCQNFSTIMEKLRTQGTEIWDILAGAYPPFVQKAAAWQKMQQQLALAHFENVPSGKQLIREVVARGGSQQVLTDVHNEIAACVNLKESTSLDVAALNAKNLKVFNLDLHEALRQGVLLGLDPDAVAAFSLGAYVATEMVLVEDQGKPRLPMVIVGAGSFALSAPSAP